MEGVPGLDPVASNGDLQDAVGPPVGYHELEHLGLPAEEQALGVPPQVDEDRDQGVFKQSHSKFS